MAQTKKTLFLHFNHLNMKSTLIVMLIMMVIAGCTNKPAKQKAEKMAFTGAAGEVKLITLDPGHFHAALVQKSMYKQVDSTVYVYAPDGQDVKDHLAKIEGYNARKDNPTAWNERIYTGSDYLEKMLTEKPGNVVVLAGNNAKKTEYILKSVEAGLNVLSDKPMVITPEQFPMLEQAFAKAAEKKTLLYDIMTERYEITTILQKELSHVPDVFGDLLTGTPENPAITKESVHHFSKMVSGSALKRPAWFFDTEQQGEGIVDVTTHLVDLVQWEAFPEITLKKEDVEMISAKRWTTDISPDNFKKVTGLEQYPDYLQKSVENNMLKVYSNGEINYKIKGICAKVSVIWNFEAPAGAGDTHFSIMRGTKSNLVIRQGAEQQFKPTLYIEPVEGADLKSFESQLSNAVQNVLNPKYPGIKLVKLADRQWTIEIPAEFKVSHEAHFAQVTEKYLRFLTEGKLPEWEVPNMIVKYYTTTEALKLARK
jgi:predicted dehydrogenase